MGAIGIGGAATALWQAAAVSGNFDCVVFSCNSGWYAYRGINKFGGVQEPGFSDGTLSFIAGVEPQSYARQIKCPILILAPTNSPVFPCDRAYDTVARTEEGVYTAVRYSVGGRNTADCKCFACAEIFLENFLHAPKGQADLDSLCAEYDAVLCACGRGAVLPADKNGYVKDNLFAAGSCVKNQKSLTPLQAMASAAKAAHAARNLLEGFDIDYESDERTARGLERFAGLGDREIDDLAPVAPAGGTYTGEEAREEASRCLGCGRPYERNKTCWYCLPCEVVCPTQALHVRIPYLIR